MKIILLGKGRMLANMIESAIDTGIEIAGVFRYERNNLSPFKLFWHDLFKTSHDLTLIKKYRLPEIKCKSANSEEFRTFVLKANADIILVGTWREKIKKEIFSMPKIGTVNIHPSLLPRYRGPNPYSQVIMRGEKKSGVTIHLMDENFDTGAILLQKEVEILPNDTAKELRERMFSTTRDLTAEFLRRIQTEIFIPIKQNETRASYFGHLDENLKMLDFKNKTAEELYATVRAFHPWLPCYITVGNQFYAVNPYNFKILNNHSYTKIAGEIVDKDTKTRSLTIISKDGRAIKADKLRIYGIFKRPFTKFFIKKIKTLHLHKG